VKKRLGIALLAALAFPLASELRVARPVRRLTGEWQRLPIEPRGSTPLGISFRPPQVDALQLDLRDALTQLLEYPFEVLRLGAYWRRMAPAPSTFITDELDWQLDAAEAAGKQVVLCVGAVKTFGYPEFFVPPHRLPNAIREGIRVRPSDHGWLLEPALEFITRIVERYRDRRCIVGWQVEHESVDPLGLEHSWRLDAAFVRAEIATVRQADPLQRPILLNGFWPMSYLVALQQWWRTRDQGDSVSFALHNADIVGLDVYPRHGLLNLGPLTAYLAGGHGPVHERARDRVFAKAQAAGRRVMISEGQAEPWETIVRPPNPSEGVMYSCTPEQLIHTYNACLSWSQHLYAYLFWGAEYWLLRARAGDRSYLNAFARVLERSG
jgi:hypothetical protein